VLCARAAPLFRFATDAQICLRQISERYTGNMSAVKHGDVREWSGSKNKYDNSVG